MATFLTGLCGQSARNPVATEFLQDGGLARFQLLNLVVATVSTWVLIPNQSFVILSHALVSCFNSTKPDTFYCNLLE